MKLREHFGYNKKRIFEQNFRVTAVVTHVKRNRWYQVNTKSVRRYSGDGSLYPHTITFQYQIDGRQYEGKHWIPWYKQPPAKGSEITLYLDPNNHEHYAYNTEHLGPSFPGGECL